MELLICETTGMASNDSERWHLPEPLGITKNPMVKIQADQMRHELEKRAVSPFARLSPEEFAKVRARSRIQHLYRSLRLVEEQLRQSRGRVEHLNLNAARDALKTRLAENLAVVGNYALAAELHPDEAHRLEYVKQIRNDFRDFL